MRITLLQRDIRWCDPAANLAETERLIDGVPQTDLIVMAEMFPTGFCMEPSRTAEPASGGPALAWMRRLAAERQCAMAGSVAVEEEGRFHNRFYFVRPDGTECHYDKRHLFAYGGETRAYTPGTGRVVAEYMGVRFLLLVCYDLRFPVWARNAGDYDVMLCAANWPASRVAVWDTLLRARAMENQCYVAGVNRIGSDPSCAYCGHSRAFDAYGREAADLDVREGAVSFEADMEALQAFRRKFPVLDDRDRFAIAR